MTTKDYAAAIRNSYKAKGWSARDISVRIDSYSMGSSIDVQIKNPSVNFAEAERIADEAESIRRCHLTGDILSGGNRYVSVGYSREAEEAIRAQYAEVLADAASKVSDTNSLEPITGTPFMMGRGSNGWGFSLWGDRHIVEANEAIHLATYIAKAEQVGA